MLTSEVLAIELSTPTPKGMATKAARGVVWTSVQSLIVRLSGVVVFLVLARLLQPVEFGLLAAAQVFVALSRVLAESGLTRTLVQKPQLRAAHLDSALLVSGGIGALLTALMIVGAPAVASIYHLPGLTPVLIALSVIPLITGLSSVPESILRRQLKFRSIAMRGTFSTVLSGAVGVALALLGAGVWALVVQAVAQVMIALVVLWSQADWMPSHAWERAAIRDLLGFGTDVMGISLLTFFNRRSGEFLIGVVLGPLALGLYSVAMRILTLVMDLLIANVQKIALPVFSRVSEQPARLRAAYMRATSITTLTAFPGFAMLGLFGNQLCPLLFGHQWVHAGPLMSVLAFIGPVLSLAVFNNSVMLAVGASRRALAWTTVLALSNFVAFAASVHFGILAVAIAFVSTGWLLLPVGLYLVRSVSSIGLWDQLSVLAAPMGGCLVMIAGVLVFKHVTDLGVVAEVVYGIPVALTLYAITTLPFRWSVIAYGVSTILNRGQSSEPGTVVDGEESRDVPGTV